VDLLVEFDRPVGLFQFFRVQRRLEAIVGRPVDLVMKDAIKSQLRTRILATKRSVPPREWRLRIEDILAAVERVQRYTTSADRRGAPSLSPHKSGVSRK
jgi:hypothetical protein